MTSKLWAGRFTKQTHGLVEKYTASIEFDKELAIEDILGSLAHADMLVHCGIINAKDGKKLQIGLKKIAKKIEKNQVSFCIEDEDIHMNIERMLSEEVGEISGKLHTARSRNDQVALDLHLYLRKQILNMISLIIELQYTFINLAKQHKTVILPGYTHLQRAQPVLLAKHWLAYVAMLQRDVERLLDAWKRVNCSPLGACALAGTTFATDKQYVASLLGFDDIYQNTLDAVSDRDFVVEFLSNSAILMMHLSRLSEELILWSSQEFNFIAFDDAFCTGSSIMPQKKNPDVVELGRGKTGRVYGALFNLLTILKGLPLAYNKDLQEDKEPLFDVIHTLRQTLTVYIPLMSSITVNKKVMREACVEGFLNATVLAEYLVKKGMTFRKSHEIVGKMVAFCIEKKSTLEKLSLTEMQKFADVIEKDIYQVLSIEQTIIACGMDHKTKVSSLEMQLEIHELQINKNQDWVNDKSELIAKVYEQYSIPFHALSD